jgi:hypothetical protein
LLERIEALDANNNARFENIEASLNKKGKEQSDQAAQRETAMEEHILQSVNDQVDVVMAQVNATIIEN